MLGDPDGLPQHVEVGMCSFADPSEDHSQNPCFTSHTIGTHFSLQALILHKTDILDKDTS